MEQTSPRTPPPAYQETLDIILRHQYIGVGENDPIVAGCVPSAHAIVQLWIGTHLFVADDHLRRPVGMARDQALDKGQDRIVRPCDAKNNLIKGIIEPETRFQCLFAEIIEAANGPHHGDPWGGARRRKGCWPGPCPDRREPDTDQIEKDQEKAKPRRRICHRHRQAPGLVSDFCARTA
jgi:hypothetical protein